MNIENVSSSDSNNNNKLHVAGRWPTPVEIGQLLAGGGGGGGEAHGNVLHSSFPSGPFEVTIQLPAWAAAISVGGDGGAQQQPSGREGGEATIRVSGGCVYMCWTSQ